MAQGLACHAFRCGVCLPNVDCGAEGVELGRGWQSTERPLVSRSAEIAEGVSPLKFQLLRVHWLGRPGNSERAAIAWSELTIRLKMTCVGPSPSSSGSASFAMGSIIPSQTRAPRPCSRAADAVSGGIAVRALDQQNDRQADQHPARRRDGQRDRSGTNRPPRPSVPILCHLGTLSGQPEAPTYYGLLRRRVHCYRCRKTRQVGWPADERGVTRRDPYCG